MTQALSELQQTKKSQAAMDQLEARVEYQKIVAALGKNETPQLGADEISKLQEYVGKSDLDLQADVQRAAAFVRLRELKQQEPELETAFQKANAAIDEHDTETQKLLDARNQTREPLEAELEKTHSAYRSVHLEISSLRSTDRELPPEPVGRLQNSIAVCREKSRLSERRLRDQAERADRELRELRGLDSRTAEHRREICRQIIQTNDGWHQRLAAFDGFEKWFADQFDEFGLWNGPPEPPAKFCGLHLEALYVPGQNR